MLTFDDDEDVGSEEEIDSCLQGRREFIRAIRDVPRIRRAFGRGKWWRPEGRSSCVRNVCVRVRVTGYK